MLKLDCRIGDIKESLSVYILNIVHRIVTHNMYVVYDRLCFIANLADDCYITQKYNLLWFSYRILKDFMSN